MGRPILSADSLHVSEDIVPIAELKAHLSEVVSSLATRRRPYVVTQNGRPAAVILSPAEFDRLSRHARFVSAVDDGLADVAEGKVVSEEALGALVDAHFGRPPKAKRPRR